MSVPLSPVRSSKKAKTHKDTRSRNYVFTWNNYDDATKSHLSAIQGDGGHNIRCIAYAAEVAPSTGTPHLQGFICFSEKVSHSAVCLLLWPDRRFQYCAEMKGKIYQSELYCSKSDTLVVLGTLPKDPGDREKTDWVALYESAKQGKIEEIPAHRLIQYYRTFKEIAKDNMVSPPNLSKPCGIWLYGKAGAGKSYAARSNYPDAYRKPLSKWWDGYQGQKHVIMDDMDPFHKSLAYEIKLWTDETFFIAETKGGALCIRPEVFIITSQYLIEEVWEDDKTRDAITRRCKVVKFPDYDPKQVRLGILKF